MRSKKILVIFMAVMLLVATFISAMAVGADGSGNTRAKTKSAADDENLPEVPKVTVAGVDVLGAPEFFELSLRVSAQAFQSVGVVLSYNTDVLTPVEWSVDAETSDEPVDPGDPENPETPETPEDGTEDTGGTGGEETQAPETPAGQPREVQVNGSSWNNPTVLPTKGADGLAGKPALAYTAQDEEGNPTKRAYLYLGADALEYTPLRQEQVVTVRFRKSAKDVEVTLPVDDPNVTSENFTVCLAPAQIAADAIPGAQLLSTAGKGADGEPLVYTYGDLIQENGSETPYGLTFTKTEEPSINTGGSGGGDYAITFFDWDGRVMDAISADADATEELAILMERQKQRLEGKAGYAFDTWLIATQAAEDAELQRRNNVFTSNDAPLDTSDPDIRTAVVDFTNLAQYENKETGSKSVLVQAAYAAKTRPKYSDDLVNNGSTESNDAFYTISEPVYTRYGSADATTGSYSLTMTVTRKQQTWGVTRLREPAVWVAMKPTGSGNPANIMSLIRLENTDTTTFEIVTNKQVASVQYMIIDAYGVSNWTGAGAHSDPNASKDLGTCIRNGTRGYLAKQAWTAANQTPEKWEATVDAQAFADCFYGLTGNANTQRANTAFWTEDNGTTIGRQTKAKNALKAASASGELTYDQVYNILLGVS